MSLVSRFRRRQDEYGLAHVLLVLLAAVAGCACLGVVIAVVLHLVGRRR